MGSNNNDDITELIKKTPSIEDLRILDIHDKYRLHLTRDFRNLISVDTGDRIIVAKESETECPYCKKKLRLPGYRLFIAKKENYAVIIELSDKPVQGTQINLS